MEEKEKELSWLTGGRKFSHHRRNAYRGHGKRQSRNSKRPWSRDFRFHVRLKMM
ncbi:hypothetical protein [Blautia sp. An81]|uniref:hypothetical protein n=1 Tax=Blautia sp. An81 TaxID=1965659 RepID=UPI0013040B7B|nr:hypothetical protein [Blautia sp. An81]